MIYSEKFLGFCFHDTIAAVAQEIAVLLVFFLSLLIFRSLANKRTKPDKPKRASAPQPSQPPTSPKKASAPPGLELVDGIALQALQAAEAQMLKLLEGREFTRALNLFRTFERDGRDRHFSEDFFASFIQSSIRVRKLDVVERLLRSMKTRGDEPSSDFWRTTLRMLSSRKHFETCLVTYAIFGDALPADKVVFSCLINSALEHGSPDRAVAMLDRYCKCDLEPKDYVLLFRTFVAARDLEAAEKTFRIVAEKMTPLMMNLLLLTCVNAKQPEHALQLLHEALALQAEGEPIVDIVSYNTVIKGFAQAGTLVRCFDCLHEMRRHNLDPDEVTFGTLLDLCMADNDMTATNKIVELVVDGDKPIDTVMCTMFIKGFVRAHQLPKALELYEQMKRRSSEASRPDIVTYSVLIKAFVDTHDMERALLLVEDMTTAGHRPDDIIFTHLIEGCRHVGNLALGKKLFEDMMAAGVKPSDFTLITLVKLYGRCGAHEEAYNIVANWEEQHGSKPSVIHYTCLMSGCLRSKNYDQAWQAYQLMMKGKVMPDETTMATLLPSMVMGQQWENVMTLVTQALTSPTRIPIADETLNSALLQMRSKPGQAARAEDLQIMMRASSVRSSTRSAKCPW